MSKLKKIGNNRYRVLYTGLGVETIAENLPNDLDGHYVKLVNILNEDDGENAFTKHIFVTVEHDSKFCFKCKKINKEVGYDF